MSKHTKTIFWLITYGVLLFLAFSHLNTVLAALRTFVSFLRPVLFGVAFAFLLNLLLSRMEEKWLAALWKRAPHLGKHRRSLCIVLTLLLVALALWALGGFILPQVASSAASLANVIPVYAKTTAEYLNGLWERLGPDNPLVQSLQKMGSQLLDKSATLLSDFLETAAPMLLGAIGQIGSSLVNFFLGLVFAIYMLVSRDKVTALGGRMLDAYLKPETAARVRHILGKVNRTFSNFISGQMIEAVILGALCAAGMAILRLPYPVLIGTIVGVTGLIPILGAYLGTIPSALLIFMISPRQALFFVIFIVVLQQIEGNLIYPRVVGGSIGLDGLWVLMALIVGGNMFGLMGMVLGIPAFAVAFSLLQESLDHRLGKEDGNGEG